MTHLGPTTLSAAEQEAIPTWPTITAGRDPISERNLREIVAEPVWERQVPTWSQLSGIRLERRKHRDCRS